MNDKEQIENVVQLYVDSMDESNPDINALNNSVTAE